jgi:cytochrome c-type biogenesis protein CcmF
MNFGNAALAVGFAASVTALVTTFLWARGMAQLMPAARRATLLMALALVAASAFQMYNILTHQFQYEYVTNFSDRSLPLLILAATFWGGQSGSFMLWALWSTLFALILSYGLRRSSWEPFVLAPYLLVTVCVVGIMWASGPFRTLASPPQDGEGLNPLLQNYWMAIHPPILFTGFTSMAGPFAFAVAALWRRDYDGWVKLARPWVLLAWICLGTGLALGGFWAYESLGWGGFWGWDPVENSSLVPWLFASALIHGLTLQAARGGLRRANLALAIGGELMVIYSTFLTRSGILGKFSVHSFVELGLMGYLVVFIVGFALLGFGLLIWRWRSIGRRVSYTSVLSREFGLVVSVALFMIIMLIVAIGTSMPVISLLPVFPRQMTVDLGWYGPTTMPFGVLILLTMAVGPLLGWQRSKEGSLLRALKWPAVLSGVALLVSLLLNITYPIALLLICGAVFAASANAVVIARIWRAGPLKLGGYLCHIGVGLLFLGIVGNAFYKQTAAMQLTADTPQTAFGRQFVFRDIVLPPDDPLQRTAVQIEVMDPNGGRTWVAEAPYYLYQKTQQLVIHPAIQSGLLGDLYVEPSQYVPSVMAAPGMIVLQKGQTIDALGYTVTFEQFELPNRDAMIRGESPPEAGAVLTIKRPDGTSISVTPMLAIAQGQMQGQPVAIGQGVTVALTWVDPASQMTAVQFEGVDLSQINPDDLKPRLFVEVSYEPSIKLVWAGIAIGVVGGGLAFVRRRREARPADGAISEPHPYTPPRERPTLQPGVAAMTTESEVRG